MKVYYCGGELYHHGVLGQKWGVRRYQNPDGTLTEAGKKRYNKLVKIETKVYEQGKYGNAKRKADKQFNKMQKKFDYENENDSSSAKTKYKYNLAKIKKEGYDIIDQYAKKTIKEIDPSSYKSNNGQMAVTRYITVYGSNGIPTVVGTYQEMVPTKYISNVTKDIDAYGSTERKAMRQRQKKEKEKYKNAKKRGIEY